MQDIVNWHYYGKSQKNLSHKIVCKVIKMRCRKQNCVKSSLIVEGHFDFEGGVLGIQSLLTQSSRPTAVFFVVVTPLLSVHTKPFSNKAYVFRKIFLIMGYDDWIGSLSPPPSSTICQPKAELGKLAVETLLQRIKNPNENYLTLVLEPTCVLRESIYSFK